VNNHTGIIYSKLIQIIFIRSHLFNDSSATSERADQSITREKLSNSNAPSLGMSILVGMHTHLIYLLEKPNCHHRQLTIYDSILLQSHNYRRGKKATVVKVLNFLLSDQHLILAEIQMSHRLAYQQQQSDSSKKMSALSVQGSQSS